MGFYLNKSIKNFNQIKIKMSNSKLTTILSLLVLSVYLADKCHALCEVKDKNDVTEYDVEEGGTMVLPHDGGASQGCTCRDGTWDCEWLSCSLPPSPKLPYPEDMKYSDCFDPWLNSTVKSGVRYERTRPMSKYQDLTGTFACKCSYGRIRCTAKDIPCCDAKSKQYKDLNEPTWYNLRGSLSECKCKRGRASVENCSATRKNTHMVCRDNLNGKVSNAGDSYTRQKGNMVQQCTCRQHGNRIKLRCSFLYSLLRDY